MRANYGCPYQGSKNFLAERIIDVLPSSETFVDLFAGGCAVTHAALTSGRFSSFVANDIGPMPSVFLDAVYGAASGSWLRWVGAEEFQRERAKPEAERDDALICAWSFGSNCSSYIYGWAIEPWKHALWEARVNGDFTLLADMGIYADDVSNRAVREHADEWGTRYVAWFRKTQGKDIRVPKSVVSFARVESLETLRRLQQLETLALNDGIERLEVTRLDYRDVPIPKGATVYCDPPYAATDQGAYDGGIFNSKVFWAWVRSCNFPVFVSEYEAPDDFVPFATFRHLSRMNYAARRLLQEHVFVHRRYRRLFGL